MTDDKEPLDKVKKGLKEVVGGTAGVVEGTAQGIKEAVEDTKEEVDETANEKDTEKYSKSYEGADNRQYENAGGKDPMDPDDITKHEPTAVKRDQDTEITEEGQTGTDSSEAQDKYRKKGMTEA